MWVPSGAGTGTRVETPSPSSPSAGSGLFQSCTRPVVGGATEAADIAPLRSSGGLPVRAAPRHTPDLPAQRETSPEDLHDVSEEAHRCPGSLSAVRGVRTGARGGTRGGASGGAGAAVLDLRHPEPELPVRGGSGRHGPRPERQRPVRRLG